jgi:hypothetical protein
MNFKQTVELILLEKKSKKKSNKKRAVKKRTDRRVVSGVLAGGWGYGGIWDGCCDSDGGGE